MRPFKPRVSIGVNNNFYLVLIKKPLSYLYHDSCHNYHEGKAVYITEPGVYSLILSEAQQRCKSKLYQSFPYLQKI